MPESAVFTLCPQDPTNTEWPDTSTCDGANGEGFTQDFETLLNEVLCTFLFVTVILVVKGKETNLTSDGVVGALTVALTLFGLIMAGGKFGAAYNPAVGLSVTLWGYKQLDAAYILHYMYAYTVGPLLGGALAGGFYNLHKRIAQDPDKAD